MDVSSLPPNGQAALLFAARGWPVFPCSPRDKTPLLPRDQDAAGKPIPKSGGVTKASADPTQIAAWWKRWPKALVAIATGHPTLDAGGKRLFVVDFDPRVDADTGEVYELDRLKGETEAQIGAALPLSLTAMTPSDGVHLYLLQDDGAAITNRGNLPDHVDVRGLGGYVIAPPSVMGPNAIKGQGGRGYRWRRELPVADAPAKLLAVLRAAKARAPVERTASSSGGGERARPAAAGADPDEGVRRYALAALDAECERIRTAPSGKRNAQLNASAFAVAALVAAGALSAGLARAAVEDAARANPGQDDAGQLEATITSGWTAGLGNPRDLSEVRARSEERQQRRGERRARSGGTAAGASPPPDGPASPPPPAGAGSTSFQSGRAEPSDPLSEGERARAARVAVRWLERRCAAVERAADPVRRLAFAAGLRVGAGLLEAGAAKEALWPLYDKIADLTHAEIDRALDDGAARGLDPRRQRLIERCLGYPMTDFGVGERFRDRFGGDFRFTTAKGWLGWDGRRWKVLDQDEKSPPAEVIAAVFETVRAIQDEARWMADTGIQHVVDPDAGELALEQHNPHGLDQLIPKGKALVKLSAIVGNWGRQCETAGKPASIAMLARRWLTLPIEDFDRDPLSLNVQNGTLRFARERRDGGGRTATVQLDGHRREDLNTRLAPVVYDPQAGSPIYDGFLSWAQPDAAMRRYLHQCAGYAASGDTSEQKLWFWYGLGANGKSTAIDLWAHVLGDYSGTIGIETFLDQGIKKRGEQASPDLARLGGVRLLRASEPERGARLNEALVKAATGGEPMAVRALHRGFFDLQPLFKLFIGGNYKPDVPGTDEGIWRRLKLVMWNAHVADGDRDETLPAKLRAEASGVLNHIVAGLLDWLQHGLVEPETVRAATQQYREDSDPLARFLQLCTAMDAESRVQSSRLHEVFVAWCKAAGEREWSQKGFSTAMKNKGFVTKASNGMQWLGLRLTRSVEDFVDANGRVREIVDPEPPPPASGWSDDDGMPP